MESARGDFHAAPRMNTCASREFRSRWWAIGIKLKGLAFASQNANIGGLGAEQKTLTIYWAESPIDCESFFARPHRK